jgi:undecaprenyl-diphosphatase
MNYFQILILAVIQGACELLPVSSSAHVIAAEKFMGLDPKSPEMTMLLVMLHTGTMFAVITFFWKTWKRAYFRSPRRLKQVASHIVLATGWTAIVGLTLQLIIEKVFMRGHPHAEIEELFDNLPLIAGSLAAVGLLIIISGAQEEKVPRHSEIHRVHACWIGVVQGLCLPFRGFSRSGSTISAGLLMGLPKLNLEEFSFALAVVITPLAIAKEAVRLLKAQHASQLADAHAASFSIVHLFVPDLVGMVFSFVAGYAALQWLTDWLEAGRWKIFGFYCLAAAGGIMYLHVQNVH